jgi:hypothetical protein
MFMKIVGGAVGVLVLIIWGITQYAMSAEKKQNEKISVIPVIQQDVKNIKESMREIKENVKEIRKQLRRQINRDDLNRLIEEVKNNGK